MPYWFQKKKNRLKNFSFKKTFNFEHSIPLPTTILNEIIIMLHIFSLDLKMTRNQATIDSEV